MVQKQSQSLFEKWRVWEKLDLQSKLGPNKREKGKAKIIIYTGSERHRVDYCEESWEQVSCSVCVFIYYPHLVRLHNGPERQCCAVPGISLNLSSQSAWAMPCLPFQDCIYTPFIIEYCCNCSIVLLVTVNFSFCKVYKQHNTYIFIRKNVVYI